MLEVLIGCFLEVLVTILIALAASQHLLLLGPQTGRPWSGRWLAVLFNSLPEFMNFSFFWEDHFSGKSKVWTFFGPSTQPVS